MLQRILPGYSARAEGPPRFRNAPSVTGADLVAFIIKARIRSMNRKRVALPGHPALRAVRVRSRVGASCKSPKNAPAWVSEAECPPKPLGHPSGSSLFVSHQHESVVGLVAMLVDVEPLNLFLRRDPESNQGLDQQPSNGRDRHHVGSNH